MTSQNVLQTALVAGAACLFFGYIGCSLFDLYRKGGQRDLENWLDAEVDVNVGLLNHIEDIELALKNERQTTEELRTLIQNLSSDGTGEGERVSGPVNTALPSSSEWNCEEQGHRFVTTNVNGEVARVCMHCPANGGSAA